MKKDLQGFFIVSRNGRHTIAFCSASDANARIDAR
jgi:hypothetical protein